MPVHKYNFYPINLELGVCFSLQWILTELYIYHNHFIIERMYKNLMYTLASTVYTLYTMSIYNW